MPHPELMHIAEIRLKEMLILGEVSHYSISGQDVTWHVSRRRLGFGRVGENVGQGHFLESMHPHWMLSAGHRRNVLAPHWTQRHIIDEYYKRRRSPKERFVAFQMNWKGENFYTGNRVVVYVSTKNKNFEKWVDKHRGERHFFITEYKRYPNMSKRAAAASGPIQPFADTSNKYKAGWADKL